jgi:HK97 family phage prohead protease
MTIKVRDFDLSIKSVADDGLFSGWASVYGNVDHDNEIVAAGAFTESLAARKAKGRKLPILWSHRVDQPLGVYDHVEDRDKGLYVEGRLLTEDVPKAREVHALLKNGVVDGLSIGYSVISSSYDEKTSVRTLTRLDLEEVSICMFPCNEEARIDAVKFKLAHGGLPTLPEFEKLLRESGFSKSQAAVVANRGLSHLLRSESGASANQTATSELLTALRGFSLPPI